MTKKKNKGGRPAKTGSHTLIHRADKLAAYPHVRRYIEATRKGLLADLGGEGNLSTQQSILVERIVCKLSIVRMIEVRVAEAGVFKPGADVELVNALGTSYLAYSNSIRLSLVALGLKRVDAGGDWDSMIRARYAKKPDQVVKDEKIVAPGPLSQAGDSADDKGGGE